MNAFVTFPHILISGGQTGADRAALDFAIARGLSHAGFCPRGRRSEDGPIPMHYNLTETEAEEFTERTRCNIALGDATVIFHKFAAVDLARLRSGSGLTLRQAHKQHKPVLVLHHFPDVKADAQSLAAFLKVHRPKVLNVAGSRESRQPGISAHVLEVLAVVAAALLTEAI